MNRSKHERQRFAMEWQVGWAKSEVQEPGVFVPAEVPGAVQLDWAKAQGWKPYWTADCWKEYAWMEDVFWTYRSVLKLPALKSRQRLFLVIRGIDYRFSISLNQEVLVEQEGMFTPVEVDLTGKAKDGDRLSVRIHPAPKSHPRPDRSQANQSCKPAVSYGWDFHPRLIPLGIWDEACLEIRPDLHVKTWETDCTLSDDFSRADLKLKTQIAAPEKGELCWKILDGSGKSILEKKCALAGGAAVLEGSVDKPELWWTHDQGRPVLYRNRIELWDGKGTLADVCEQDIGFRRIRLVMHEGAWDWPDTFPKSRSHPPVTLELNGRVLFAKGSNWVSPDIFPGTIGRGACEAHLRLVKDAHMNLLRMWGGAAVQKDSFFEICDQLGILVWQEFPLACNDYAGTPEYLRILDQESKSIIKRLKSHPSLALWCGGNELFNSWSKMTDQSAALRLLNRNCFDLDPERPFLMTSPVEGMGHGHYVFRDPGTGQEAWDVFQEAARTAYCEFGCPGPASREILESIIPSGDLFPPRPGTAWEGHHAFGAWMDSSHLYLDVIEHYFGASESLDQIVERGQLLQSEGYKGLFEEARRQKPRASMALNWCLNEPWPCAANNSLVSWPCRPKPALAAVGQSCRPILSSARIRKFQWHAGENFDAELWMLSDSPEAQAADEMEAWLEYGQKKILLLTWQVPALEPNRNCRGPRLHWQLPDLEAERFKLALRMKKRTGADSQYILKFSAAKPAKKRSLATN